MGLFPPSAINFFSFKLKKREFTHIILPLVKGYINKASLSSKFVYKQSKPLELEKYASETPKKNCGAFFDTIALGFVTNIWENAAPQTFP